MAGLTRLDPPARQARSWLFVAGFGLGGRRVKSPRAAADVSRGDRARIGRADVGERWEAVVGEETWHAARLIPTSGINGAEEQERRATSALLAVTTAVREFGRSLTTRFGAPAGAVEAFIEVPFDVGDTTLYPDGLLRVKRGRKTWTALVATKKASEAAARTSIPLRLIHSTTLSTGLVAGACNRSCVTRAPPDPDGPGGRAVAPAAATSWLSARS